MRAPKGIAAGTRRRRTRRGSRRRRRRWRGVRQTPFLSARLSRRTRTDTQRTDHPSPSNTVCTPSRPPARTPDCRRRRRPGSKNRVRRIVVFTRAQRSRLTGSPAADARRTVFVVSVLCYRLDDNIRDDRWSRRTTVFFILFFFETDSFEYFRRRRER